MNLRYCRRIRTPEPLCPLQKSAVSEIHHRQCRAHFHLPTVVELHNDETKTANVAFPMASRFIPRFNCTSPSIALYIEVRGLLQDIAGKAQTSMTQPPICFTKSEKYAHSAFTALHRQIIAHEPNNFAPSKPEFYNVLTNQTLGFSSWQFNSLRHINGLTQ